MGHGQNLPIAVPDVDYLVPALFGVWNKRQRGSSPPGMESHGDLPPVSFELYFLKSHVIDTIVLEDIHDVVLGCLGSFFRIHPSILPSVPALHRHLLEALPDGRRLPGRTRAPLDDPAKATPQAPWRIGSASRAGRGRRPDDGLRWLLRADPTRACLIPNATTMQLRPCRRCRPPGDPARPTAGSETTAGAPTRHEPPGHRAARRPPLRHLRRHRVQRPHTAASTPRLLVQRVGGRRPLEARQRHLAVGAPNALPRHRNLARSELATLPPRHAGRSTWWHPFGPHRSSRPAEPAAVVTSHGTLPGRRSARSSGESRPFASRGVGWMPVMRHGWLSSC